MKKFIVLVICALIGMLSIPHVTLWSFSLGSVTVEAATEKVYADPTSLNIIGKLCPALDGKHRCAYVGGTVPFEIVDCSAYHVWARPESTLRISRADYGQCRNYCESTYGANCIEPYSTMTRSPDENMAPGAELMTITSTTNSIDVQSHMIQIRETGSRNVVWPQKDCGAVSTCSYPNTFNGAGPGNTVQYWSDVVLDDGTHIRNPQTGEYTFILSPSGTTPPTPSTCSGSAPTTPPCTAGQSYQCISNEWKCAATAPGSSVCTSDAQCTTPPSPVCDEGGYTLLTYSSPGICLNPNCVYISPSTTNCPNGCQNGQCVGGTGTPGTGELTIYPIPVNVAVGSTVQLRVPNLASSASITSAVVTNTDFATSTIQDLRIVTVRGVAPGTTEITLTDSTSKTGTATINVQAGTGGTGSSTNHCCVELHGTDYSYDGQKSEQTCGGDGGAWKTTNCANAAKDQCSEFCRLGEFGSSGTCSLTAGTQARTFDNVCDSNNKCVCQGTAQQNAANVPCAQACYTASGVTGYLSPAYSTTASSFPIGQCTSNPQYLFMAVGAASAATTSGAAYSQQPRAIGNPGQHGCNSDETCWCTFVNTNTFRASNTAATLPGTQTAGTWTHPNDITASAPRATPNDHDCTLASNATITASLGIAGTTQTSGTSSTAVSRLIQAGDTVTITGKVTKMADACKGYKYNCIQMQQLGCESHNRVLWTSLSYKDCPAGTTQIHAEGAGRTGNWQLIAAIGVAVASVFTGSAAAFAYGSLSNSFFVSSAATAVQAAVNGANCGGTNQNAANGLGTMIYSMYNAANANQCSSKVNQQTCQNANCVWTNNQCQTRSGTTGANNAICQTCTAQGYVGYCTNNNNCGYTGPCNGGDFVNCGSTSTSGTSSNPSSTGRYLCISDAGNYYCSNDCGTDYNYGACPTSTSAAATAKPTFDVTGDATSLPVTGMSVPTYAGGTVPTDGLLLPPASSGASAAATSAYAPMAGMGTSLALSYLPTCPSAQAYASCFSVCGKTYDTPVAASPLCNQGGPVIGFTDATYPCATGTCGAYANKRVKIDIRGPDGSQAIQDYVTTDSQGDFSYTFQAPAADGEFTAIVSVPSS